MIRVIIVLISAFIIWVLFFSKLSKQAKAAVVACAVIISVFGFWFESGANKPRANVVQQTQVSSCGVSAKHSYRTNFAIMLCVRNNAQVGDVKRLNLTIIAEQCADNICVEQQRMGRDLSVNIPALSSIELVQNLNFTNLEPNLDKIRWSFVVNSVKAQK